MDSISARTGTLRRSCACGGSTLGGGPTEGPKKTCELQRRAVDGSDISTGPPLNAWAWINAMEKQRFEGG